MPSTTHVQGTPVPSTTHHDQNQLTAQREANDAAARASFTRSMGSGRNTALSVKELMQAAFFNGRTPRSAEYKAGTRAALENRIEQKDIVFSYEAGTTETDAYFAGIDEGRSIWHAAVAKIGGAA